MAVAHECWGSEQKGAWVPELEPFIGDWGVAPIGKSISVSVAVALRACVRAKLCAGV